ncbi:hypothetical protein ABPG75_007097 [Micractinium tetrahymenae]
MLTSPTVGQPAASPCANSDFPHYFGCCNDKQRAGMPDPSCPTGSCRTVQPADRTACCARCGQLGQADSGCPPTQPCHTRQDYFGCCNSKKDAGMFDPACPTDDTCGSVQPPFRAACCARRAAIGQRDPACTVTTRSGSVPSAGCHTRPDYFGCCNAKAAVHIHDPACPTGNSFSSVRPTG